MRDDVLISLVTKKCEVLKRSGLWLGSPRMRPAAWLENFDSSDKRTAAKLLDRFIFYNHDATDTLLKASWNSMCDKLPKGPKAPSARELWECLDNPVFTAVEGEHPSPTDSGNVMCRKARQVLRIPDDLVKPPAEALEFAIRGSTVVFFDDFVGSGDQFVKTWKRPYLKGESFESVQAKGIYITLITTGCGLDRINKEIPQVAVCSEHVVLNKSTVFGLIENGDFERDELDNFLDKYVDRLCPTEKHIAKNRTFLKYGYHKLGMLLGFELSIPDATLPIFWSPGQNEWVPLIERT